MLSCTARVLRTGSIDSKEQGFKPLVRRVFEVMTELACSHAAVVWLMHTREDAREAYAAVRGVAEANMPCSHRSCEEDVAGAESIEVGGIRCRS